MTKTLKSPGVVIFASGNEEIGGGHLSRQQTLAKELLRIGLLVTLIGEVDNFQLSNLKKLGFDVLPVSNSSCIEEHESALQKIESDNPIHCVIIDNYSLLDHMSNSSCLWDRYPQVHFQDGKAGAPGGSILVNSGVDSIESYENGHYKSKFLGFDAVIVSEEIIKLRRSRELHMRLSADLPLGFVTLGFGSNEPVAAKLARSLVEINSELSLNFKFARREPIGRKPGLQGQQARIGLDGVGYADALSSYDICIGAAGLSAYERAFLGIPSINIPLANNQFGISRKLVAKGAALELQLAESGSFTGRLGAHLKYLEKFENRESMTKTARKLIDSDNVKRISYAISKI